MNGIIIVQGTFVHNLKLIGFKQFTVPVSKHKKTQLSVNLVKTSLT